MSAPRAATAPSAAPAAAARPAGVYRMILRQLLVASYLRTGLLIVFLIVLVATRWLATVRTATITFDLSQVAMLLFGIGLGVTTSGLWGGERQKLVPDYHRRLMRVVSATALAVWAVVPLCYALGGADHGIAAWVDLVWLWSYGTLGWGFLLGFFATRQVHWLARAALVAAFFLFFLPNLQGLSPRLHHWLFVAYAPYTPATLACLLLGPHNWPLLFSRPMPALRHRGPGPGTAGSTEQGRTASRPGDTLAHEVLQALHAMARRRADFLVLPTPMVGHFVGQLLALALVGLMLANVTGDGYLVGGIVLTLSVLLMAMGPMSAPLGRGQLGRYLLLPGAVRRRQLPAWLARRHLLFTMGALAVFWLPSLVVAVASGAPLVQVAGYSLTLLLTAMGATALRVFLPPGTPAGLGGRALALGASLLVAGAAGAMATAMGRVVDGEHLLTTAATFLAISAALYLLGLRRWRTLDLGA